MRRRHFITAVCGAMTARSLSALAQTSAKVRRIGLLNARGLNAGPFEGPLMRGLARHGYAPDNNLTLERRSAEGHADRLPQIVAELASKVEVIIAIGYLASLAAKEGTTLPVVEFSGGDPDLPTAWRGPAGTLPVSRTCQPR
jgi:putative ABC transport system substrate-binding protein